MAGVRDRLWEARRSGLSSAGPQGLAAVRGQRRVFCSYFIKLVRQWWENAVTGVENWTLYQKGWRSCWRAWRYFCFLSCFSCLFRVFCVSRFNFHSFHYCRFWLKDENTYTFFFCFMWCLMVLGISSNCILFLLIFRKQSTSNRSPPSPGEWVLLPWGRLPGRTTQARTTKSAHGARRWRLALPHASPRLDGVEPRL